MAVDLTEKYTKQEWKRNGEILNPNFAMLINEINNYDIFVLQGGTRCFAPNQLVITKDCSKKISEIQPGDLVQCLNERTKEIEWKPVKEVLKFNNQKPTVKIKLKNGREIVCSADHKFYVDGAWVEIWKVLYSDENVPNKLGIELNDIEFGSYTLKSYHPTVYDLSIADNHNYFLDCGKPILVHNSGKTYATIQFIWANMAQFANVKYSIVRQSMPTLKGTVIPDFIEIGNDAGLYNVGNHNQTEQKYKHDGNDLWFFSAEDEEKLRGRKQHFLYLNEAPELAWESVQQLLFRTSGKIIIDYNPSYPDSWVYDNILTRDNVAFIRTTFKDNPHLSKRQLDELEWMKVHDPHGYLVYGLGQRGEIQGQVYTHFKRIKDKAFPKDADIFCLDFGFSCFPGDTLITTMRGDVRIDKVTTNDFVLTRKGYRKVRNVLSNGVKKVIRKRLHFNGREIEITATDSHHFNANGTWKQYKNLQRKDSLILLSNLMGESTKDTQMGSTPTTFFANTKKKVGFIAKGCIERFINSIKGVCQKRCTSTILTTTHSITTFQTLWQFRPVNIARYINISKNLIPYTIRKLLKSMGTQKRTGLKDEKRQSKNLNLNQKLVKTVGGNLLPPMSTKNAAIANVTTNGNIQANGLTDQCAVKVVGGNLWETNILNPNAVPQSVLVTSQELQDVKIIEESWESVYDLEIDGVHEYFANGVLVHNCDPTAIIRGCIDKRTMYVKELCYKTGLSNVDILIHLFFSGFDSRKGHLLIADSANPKDISDLRYGERLEDEAIKDKVADLGFSFGKFGEFERLKEMIHNGIDVVGAIKGKGSIRSGIKRVKALEVLVTESSSNVLKEESLYKYKKDRFTGRFTQEPLDKDNHAMDCIRYMALAEGRYFNVS